MVALALALLVPFAVAATNGVPLAEAYRQTANVLIYATAAMGYIALAAVAVSLYLN